jgi:hypothetical protein
MDLVSVLEPQEDFSHAKKVTNMRNLQNVIVTRAIVHILEPKAGNIKYSNLCIPLKDNPQLSDYFAEHIKLSSRDLMARAARFSGTEPEKPSGICYSMYGSEADFIAGSKELAKQLYGEMTKTERISDGDLVVCRYLVGNAPENEFLAIIKLDPVGAFRNIERIDDLSGKTYIDLRIDPFVFPRTTDVLQKGAYIGQSVDMEAGEKLEVLLLDKQLKGAEVAIFFYKDFLGVSFVQDAAELTLRLYKCLIDALNELRPGLDYRIDKQLGHAIYAIFKQQRLLFNIYAWLDTLGLPDGTKTTIENKLKAEFPGIEEMSIDLTLVDAYTGRRSFKGQMGLNFSVPADNYESVVHDIKRLKTPGGQDYYEIKLHTTIWREGAS